MDPEELILERFGSSILTRLIHKGGYGYSFLSKDADSGLHRITKLSGLPKGSNPYLETGFIKEGHISSRLNHFQIPQFVEKGEEHGYYYITTAYVPGVDLGRAMWALRNKQKELMCDWQELLDPLTAMAVTLSLLSPLAYLHREGIELPNGEIINGVAHRHLSPGNLIVGFGRPENRMIHLIDFGFAKLNVDYSATVDTCLLASIKYLSPVRLMKKKFKKLNPGFRKKYSLMQDDIHAVGCLFREMLFGESHIQTDEFDVYQSIEEIQDPATYRNIRSEIKIFDEDVQDIINRSIVYPDLKKGRDTGQYQNASEMRGDVEAAFLRHCQGRTITDLLNSFSRKVEHTDSIKSGSHPTTTLMKQQLRSSGWFKKVMEDLLSQGVY